MNPARLLRVSVFAPIVSAVLTLSSLAPSLFAAEPPVTHTITVISTTVPSNGDVNPYGIFEVPETVGNLVKGNLLISNFNASSNFQGTGTTLVQISPSGSFSRFAQIGAAAVPGPCPEAWG